MINYLLSLILGFLVKTVDLASEHGLKLNKFVKLAFCITYGALLAYLISAVFLPEFFLGILLGVIVSSKIDSKLHLLAMIFFLTFSIFFNQPITDWLIILLVAVICYFEEWINDELVDKKKVKGNFRKFLSFRPLLEIAAVILSIIYSDISIFLLLLCFDLGYYFSKKFFHIK